MPETMYKSGRAEKFTVIYNSVLKDTRLSLKAKGMFAIMMSLPDDWTYTVSGLASYAGASKDSIRSTLKELEQVGYLIREQKHENVGKFGGNVFILQDIAPPLSENTADGKIRQREKPSTDFPTLQKTNIQNTPITPKGGIDTASNLIPRSIKFKAKWKPERFEAFWEFYRKNARGENRQKAVRAWDKLQPSDDLIRAMGHALAKQVASEEWKRGIGIPYASTWLNGARWEDEPCPAHREESGPPPEKEAFGWR